MKFNITPQQAEHFAEKGEVCLVMLKKKVEMMGYLPDDITPILIYKDRRVLCEVGRSYALCSKGKALWWCPKDNNLKTAGKYAFHNPVCLTCMYVMKRFRFKVSSIEEKRLLEITMEEAKAAGYPMPWNNKKVPFIGHGGNALLSLKWNMHFDNKLKFVDSQFQNPEVFVIKGKVLE